VVDDPASGEQELTEHLALLQRYLSDEVAPLVFAEALSDLVAHPRTVVASEIRSWVAAQYRSASPLPVADYLFHAARKLHVVAELELIPREALHGYLADLQLLLLEQCPEEDRDGLADDLANLEASQTVSVAPIQIVHRATGAEPAKLMRAVWLKAAGGDTPVAIEAGLPVDPYRVRRLIEHWVEEGSMTVA
jgi:hypothetical protein